MAKQATRRTSATVAGVRLTSPGRVLFPLMGVTKLDLARYFETIAPHMLPHVAGRPVSFVRCPRGGAPCFFQKHDGAAVGSQIRRVEITEKDGGTATYLVIDDTAGLVAAAQIGVLELHLWAARHDSLERPDRMVFDLDPGEGVAFAAVKQAARDIRDMLGDAGLECFALLTGGKGIHLVIPVEPEFGWEAFAGFASDVAHGLEAREPARFVATMAKAKRSGRIFVDYLRNQRGSTAIAPFSPRAREGAPVAVPVAWEELDGIDKSGAFSLGDVAAVEARSSAWAGYGTLRQRLTATGARRLGITLGE